jgi:sarcosine oxidase delta subunit
MLHIKCPHCGMRSQNEFPMEVMQLSKDQSLIKKYQTKIGITLSIIEKA